MRRGATALPCGKGSGTTTRPPTPLAYLLPLPLRERVGVRGIWYGMVSRCHSGLVLLVIPDVSHAVIPDVIHRESKGGVRGKEGPEKRVCEGSGVRERECRMEIPGRAPRRSESMTTGLDPTRRQRHARDNGNPDSSLRSEWE